MALVIADRVKETTTTTGTSTYTLAGAVDGFQSFAAVGNGNTTYYACTDGTDYEVGIGTYTASGTTLARTTIIESSNSDAAVNWGSGEKDIFVTVPAEKYIVRDASGNVSLTGNFAVSGTVDGRDIATDGTKLDGIESGATADQTAAEIRTLVGSASDSNVFTDADHSKLDGIESGATADQTITAGSGLSGGGTGNVTLSHSDTSSQSSVNNSGRTYIQDITLDGFGHVTGISSATETVTNTDTNTTSLPIENSSGTTQFTATDTTGLQFVGSGATSVAFDSSNKRVTISSTDTNTDTNTTYSAGSGLSLSGTTFSHSDTSSQASSNNSGRTYIQDITLDTYGHVTGIATATETVTNTDTNTTSLPIENSAGTAQFTATDTTGLQFVGSGATSVSFDSTNKRVTISSTDTNTDTNTTYSAGSGLSLSGTTFSHSDTSSQASSNNSGRTYIQDITLDTYGHVTGIATATETVVNTDTNTNQLTTFQLEDGDGTEVTISHGKEVKFVEGGGIDINWTDTSTGSDGDPYDLTFTHADTSSQASVNNSGRTYIQDITLDGYGHVTAISSATETVTNTDTTYSAGAGLDLSGTTFSVESDLRGDVYYIGRDTNDYIHVNTTVIDFYLDGNMDMRLENDGDLHVDGNVVAYSTTTSDPRLKENIQPVTNGLEKVMQLNGYTFDYKADGVSSAGILSTEVANVLPSAVKQSKLSLKLGDDNDTEYDVVQYDQLTALLIEAIKELKAEIEELKNGSTN